jgi:lipopolysaccharide/colanic/teichoic acid biosynthesis glycosyltransferase
MADQCSEATLRRTRLRSPHYEILKRALDVATSAILLVLTAPVSAVVAILIAVRMGCPIIFSQLRPGVHERPFVLHKFRTMRLSQEEEDFATTDAARLTSLGAFLRRTSLDELPQLVNVLRGDMTLVGPRPLLERYLPYYTPEERRRFEVRPGITGWAQVNGRNLSSWSERLAMDVWYVDNRSLWLDLRILIRTVMEVLSSRSVVVDARSRMQNLDEERGGG